MRVVWQVELDPYATRVLEKHWPHVRRYRDVRQCGAYNLEPVDLICGGFPCQPHSAAGKRRGADDDRNLWPEMRRIVSELKPTWVVGENVDNIVSIYLDVVCADLEAEGYEVGTVVFPAVAIGAPHIRQRAWILAYASRHRQSGGSVSVRARGPREAKAYPVGDGPALADAQGERREGWPGISETTVQAGRLHAQGVGWWATEPDVGRVAHGVPARVDRLRCLGNAVVPQVAELIGRLILEADACTD